MIENPFEFIVDEKWIKILSGEIYKNYQEFSDLNFIDSIKLCLLLG